MKNLFCLALAALSMIAIAEPQPWGLIVKDSHCAKFWAGDECNSYKAPQGWVVLYGDLIKYRSRQCKFSAGDEPACCEKLGLKYVEVSLERISSGGQAEFCRGKLK